jgi:hypothetical protein
LIDDVSASLDWIKDTFFATEFEMGVRSGPSPFIFLTMVNVDSPALWLRQRIDASELLLD